MKKYDFGGWATKNNLKCSDGRTIMKDAFAENNGKTVPLVWNHNHNDPEDVLGHALLENRDEGVYAYCSFNDTRNGALAKTLVQHGDIVSLSIFANQLKQSGSNVMHGVIREVSLVLAGANPGASIQSLDVIHGDNSPTDEGIIYTGENIEQPSDESEMSHSEDTKTEPTIESEISHSDGESNNKTEPEKETKQMAKTVKEVIDSFNDEQEKVFYAMLGLALEEGSNNTKETDNVKHNIFDNDVQNDQELVHSMLNDVLKEASNDSKSLKQTYMAHAAEYGIENLEFINTEEKDIYDRPQWINNEPSDWVSVVIGGVHHTPFEKVRMQFADITSDDSRAKGYIKGKYKKEEVFKLLKRVVSGCMIYKKQKFDRQDIINADFDIIPWVKSEMNVKFDEEKARAYLFGDGRSNGDTDKVDEDCIIPVIKDEDLYCIKYDVTPEQNESKEHAIITAAVLSQDDYQGSGNIIGFFEQKQVSKMLLMEDAHGHRLYPTLPQLATAMGINRIVKVPAGICPDGFIGVMLDLKDYNIGQKNAGKKAFFDDFDINYNQQLYLMEEQQSGALTKPYSAILLRDGN